MHYPQVLVYESDGRLARRLQSLARTRKWFVREPRRLDACLRLLRGNNPCVLVLKIGSDVVRELALLEQVHWLCPEAATVVAGDTENPALAGLAWHLGASYVLFPPQPPDLLPVVVTHLMEARINERRPPAGKKIGPELESSVIPDIPGPGEEAVP